MMAQQQTTYNSKLSADLSLQQKWKKGLHFQNKTNHPECHQVATQFIALPIQIMCRPFKPATSSHLHFAAVFESDHWPHFFAGTAQPVCLVLKNKPSSGS